MPTRPLALAGAAFLASTIFACAQETKFTPAQEEARAQACVPPPCDSPVSYPPCERPEMQHKLSNVEILALKVADGPEVRPLGGAAPPLPEVSVCVWTGAEDFIVYLPSIDEPLARLGMMNALNIAMQTRSPIDIHYGLPNGALRKIEGVGFGAPVAPDAEVKCAYGDFDRCDTGWEAVANGEKSRQVGRIARVNFFGYGKGSRAAQVFLEGKPAQSFLIDPGAAPERFLLLMNFAVTAQIAGVPVEIVSTPGKAPEDAADKSIAPPIALDITPATMR